MSKIELSISQGYYESESAQLADQACVNVYPKHAETKDAVSMGALFRTPGLSQVSTVGGAGRGMLRDTKLEYLYIVAGTNLYRKVNIGSITTIGTISGTGKVSMAYNGTVLVIIVPGSAGYFYTVSGGLVAITDAIFLDFMNNSAGGVTSVCLKDDRFIYTTDDEFFVGSTATVNNGRDFDALDYEDAEVLSDPIIRAMTIKNELYMFGKETIELYQNVGGSSFPFTRIPGATIEKGVVSRFGVIAFDNSFLFLGSNALEAPAIWRGNSGTATKVSTAAIDYVIQSYTQIELESVDCWSYTDGGSYFVGFNFPNQTFVYDATASAIQQRPIWHERTSAGTKYRVNDVVNVFGQNVVTDNVDGKVGYMRRTVFTEYAVASTRTFGGAYLQNGGSSFNIGMVELKVNGGSSNIKGTDGGDATVEMSYSVNGGATYISAGTRRVGIKGDFMKRLIWRRIGRVPYDVLFRFTTSDPIEFDAYRLDINVTASSRGQQA